MFFPFRILFWNSKIIFNNESIKYIFAVFFGAILSLGTYLFIEWFKTKKAIYNWTISLLIEVSRNYDLKQREIVEIKKKFAGIPKDYDIFEIYRNNFDIYFAFLKSGFTLDDKKILFKYSEYINNENRHIEFRKKWFKEHVEPNILRDGGLVSTSADFPFLDLVLERDLEQLELIKTIFTLLKQKTKTKYIEKDDAFKNNIGKK